MGLLGVTEDIFDECLGLLKGEIITLLYLPKPT